MKPPLFLAKHPHRKVYNYVVRAAREPRVAFANCKIFFESDLHFQKKFANVRHTI